MNRSLRKAMKRVLLAAAVAAAILFPMATAEAWWGAGPSAPGGVWGWDPQEAYLDEYGLLDPYGPTLGDLRRMQRDNWRAMMGYPVYFHNIGPYGPRPSDLRRQYHRRLERLWGYPY